MGPLGIPHVPIFQDHKFPCLVHFVNLSSSNCIIPRTCEEKGMQPILTLMRVGVQYIVYINDSFDLKACAHLT